MDKKLELTMSEREFLLKLKREGIISVRELDSYSIMVAETLVHEKVIQKESTRLTTVYIYPPQTNPLRHI